MVIIDWAALGLISIFAVSGFFNGFTKELFSVAAWVLSLVAAWFFGPLLFPYLEEYIVNPEVKKVVSFIVLFLILFIVFKFVGSLLSKTFSVLGLGGLDKILGLGFGGLKVSIILLSIFLLNMDFLEKKDWWLDSHCREITMQMAVYVEPLLREWELKSKIILENDSIESIKENLNRLL
jgi:membrane protein required for colicin V production